MFGLFIEDRMSQWINSLMALSFDLWEEVETSSSGILCLYIMLEAELTSMATRLIASILPSRICSCRLLGSKFVVISKGLRRSSQRSEYLGQVLLAELSNSYCSHAVMIQHYCSRARRSSYAIALIAIYNRSFKD